MATLKKGKILWGGIIMRKRGEILRDTTPKKKQFLKSRCHEEEKKNVHRRGGGRNIMGQIFKKGEI